MQTKRKSIENFQKYIDDLIASNYVLSDKKLTDLMRAISTSKLFFTLFEFCTDGFDYEECFKDSFQKGDSYGQGRFVLPKDSKARIALIFSLLFQINAKEINFLDILEQYFYVNNYNESYRNFALQVLIPFRAEVLRAVEAMAEDYEQKTQTNTASKSSGKKVIKTINEADFKAIVNLLEQSRSVILQYKIDANLKAELIDLYNYFKDCLYDGDAEKIRMSYLGFKYATLYHKKSDIAIRKIENILKNNQML